MNTYLDIGNSFIKAARKKGLEWETVFKYKVQEKDLFFRWLKTEDVDKIIACSVNAQVSEQLDREYMRKTLRLITYRDIPADYLSYDTPGTLGMDRFLACFGASNLVSDSVVVIDAGSACTIDLMTSDRIYQGGVIMPGLEAVRSIISEKLPELPVPEDQLPGKWPGKSTQESLQWGTTGAFFEAIKGFIGKYHQKYGSFTLFLTGGSSPVFERYLQIDYPVKVRPYLLFEGMEAFEKELL